MHIYIHMYIHIYIYAHVQNEHTYLSVYVFPQSCIHIRIHRHVCVHIIHIFTCMHIRAYMYIYEYTQTGMYQYTIGNNTHEQMQDAHMSVHIYAYEICHVIHDIYKKKIHMYNM